MGAAVDCELIREGLLGQPVNALTTIAFIIAGLMVIRRPSLRWVGIALVATGLGSFLFHGPMPSGAEWAHDTTLAWLILVVAGLGRRGESWTRLPGLLALGAVFALVPALADPTAAVLAAGAVILVLGTDRSAATVGPLALIGVTALIGRLGTTGGVLCDPMSQWQPHGLWHLAVAVAILWWARGEEARAAESKKL